MEDREVWYQTYLVKELVLGQVTDVLWLIHQRKKQWQNRKPVSANDTLHMVLP